jgi:hypothetical protein
MDEKGILPNAWIVFVLVAILTAVVVAYQFTSYEKDWWVITQWSAILGIMCGMVVVMLFKIIFGKKGDVNG